MNKIRAFEVFWKCRTSLDYEFQDISLKPMAAIATKLEGASPGLRKTVRKKLPEECHPILDKNYISMLKAFGSLPAKGTVRYGFSQEKVYFAGFQMIYVLISHFF